jgi:hypothetical protein
MAVLVKQIKPKALNAQAMQNALMAALKEVGKVIKKDFEDTTKYWKHKPKFEILADLSGPGPFVYVATDDEIYRYVNEGTKPHEIWAGAYTGKSNKRALAFPSVFTPKTKPGSLTSGRGRRGRVDTFVPMVHHPGTEAREFDKLIEEKRAKWYKRQMEDAMRKARRVSGHAI